MYLILQHLILHSVNLQFVNDLHALISPPAPGTPLPIVLLGKVWKWECSPLRHCSCLSSWWPFNACYSPKMLCCQLSCFLIKLCGLVDQAFIRYGQVAFLFPSSLSFYIAFLVYCKSKLRYFIWCRTRNGLTYLAASLFIVGWVPQFVALWLRCSHIFRWRFSLYPPLLVWTKKIGMFFCVRLGSWEDFLLKWRS